MTDEEKQLFRVTAEATLKPFGNLLERLFGGAVDQIGGEWEDRLKARRFLRRAKVYTKLKQQLDDSGIDPQEIPEKIWVPALQAVSLEDDETLQDKWASLLANAASPGGSTPVTVQFPKILANLSARDATFLDLYFDFSLNRIFIKIKPIPASTIASQSAIDAALLETMVANSRFRWQGNDDKKRTLEHLMSEGLMQTEYFDKAELAAVANALSLTGGDMGKISRDSLRRIAKERHELTILGAELVNACRSEEHSPGGKKLEPSSDS